MYKMTIVVLIYNSRQSLLPKAPNNSMKNNVNTSNKWISTSNRPVVRPLTCFVSRTPLLDNIVVIWNSAIVPNRGICQFQAILRSISSLLSTTISLECMSRKLAHATSNSLSSSSRHCMCPWLIRATLVILPSNTLETCSSPWIESLNNFLTLKGRRRFV